MLGRRSICDNLKSAKMWRPCTFIIVFEKFIIICILVIGQPYIQEVGGSIPSSPTDYKLLKSRTYVTQWFYVIELFFAKMCHIMPILGIHLGSRGISYIENRLFDFTMFYNSYL